MFVVLRFDNFYEGKSNSKSLVRDSKSGVRVKPILKQYSGGLEYNSNRCVNGLIQKAYFGSKHHLYLSVNPKHVMCDVECAKFSCISH